MQDGPTALHLAAKSVFDGVKKMELLIDKGANVTAVDNVNLFKMIMSVELKLGIRVIFFAIVMIRVSVYFANIPFKCCVLLG